MSPRRWSTRTAASPPGAQFPGSWTCTLGGVQYGGRFTVGANATVSAFTPAEQLVPATAICTITEDTLDSTGLRDGSFDWAQPTYDPDGGHPGGRETTSNWASPTRSSGCTPTCR